MNSQQEVDISSLRDEVDRLIDRGDFQAARLSLAEMWTRSAGPGIAPFVVSRFERLRQHWTPAGSQLAILRSFTIEPVVPLLRAEAFIHGVDAKIHVGRFNAYAQEILDPSSELYRFVPDIVIVMVRTPDLAPELFDGFAELSPDEIEPVVQRVVDHFQNLITEFRSRSQAHLILSTLELPITPSAGIFDAQAERGQLDALRRINCELNHLVRRHPGVYLLDYDQLIARHGRARWHDPKKWLTMRMPIAADCLIDLAKEWTRFILPLTGKTCKALVADLDNTLWGGVVGEDGLNGIKLGTEYPGAGYRALQRAMLDLYQRGIILAVCSKNNPTDAMAVLEQHPDMLLRPSHFAAVRINWQDKAQNLREIAAELNIGIDTLAFLDDNPVERQWVRSQLPEVTVIDLPEDPMGYAQALRDSPVLERLALSDEDRERGRYYAEQRLRTELEHKSVSLEDFYRSLEQEVEISSVTPQTLTRVAQMTQKTNQFNLTTRRYTEQQIRHMAGDDEWKVYSIRVRDRFGDNGLVGVAITRRREKVCEIDTLLLSCRVIARTVETALLAFIIEQARAEGAQYLSGWFFPTRQNEPAKEFYRAHGFTCSEDQNGKSRWEFNLSGGQIASPPWIKCHVVPGGMIP